jgi:threonine/homoserine/homoserine lactone efflux protein
VSNLPPPSQPYRVAVLFHGALALAILLVALLSDNAFPKALAFAGGYFLLATAWTWFRFRQRASRGSASTREPSEGSEP